MNADLQSTAGPPGWTRLIPWLLVVVGAAVYANALGGPFVYDDKRAIVENESIRSLSPSAWLGSVPAQTSVSGRPLVSLSLALNHAVGGDDVRGYHVLNILVHVAASLVLYGIVRRTLTGALLGPRMGASAPVLAGACALLWLVHPLQTECVDYTVQRTESIMGLLYLLTLYGAIRSAGPAGRRWWTAMTIVCCGLGMGAKEAMATAPIAIVLYDLAFRTGPCRDVLRRRIGLYAGLVATWFILAALNWTGPRASTIGFGNAVGSVEYALNQCVMIVRYLRLVVWPDPLVFDYGYPRPLGVGDVVPHAVLIVLLLAATVVAIVRRPPVGFPLAWFFLILGPTSSFVPIASEVGAERRMYLPLAGLVSLVVVGGFVLLRSVPARRIGAVLVLAFAAALSARTVVRNHDYRTEESIWQTGLAAVPDNPRALNNLGNLRMSEERLDDALDYHRRAVDARRGLHLSSDTVARGYFNLARVHHLRGRLDDAVAWYEQALDLEPRYAKAHHRLGFALQDLGRTTEAADHFLLAIRLDSSLGRIVPGGVGADDGPPPGGVATSPPDPAAAAHDEANALAAAGRYGESIEHYRRSLEANELNPLVHYHLGYALQQVGRVDDAITHYHRALEMKPDSANVHNSLGLAYQSQGLEPRAMAEIRHAISLNPEHADAHVNLAVLLVGRGNADEAIQLLRRALSLEPDHANAHLNLGVILGSRGHHDEAAVEFRRAVELDPGDAEASDNLGRALIAAGRYDEAVRHLRRAAGRWPDRPQTLVALAGILAAHPRPERRDPDAAIRLAARANELTGAADPVILEALATAYAAAGRYDRAIVAAEQARSLALAAGRARLAERIDRRLDGYRRNEP